MYQPEEIWSEPQTEQSVSNLQIEQSVSNLLRVGVFLASAIVLVGGVLYLIRHGTEPADYQFFRGEPSVFCSPAGVVTAVLSGSERGIIQLGLLVLIADFTYAILTLCVLAGLICSLM